MVYVIKVEYEGSLRRVLASRAENDDLSLAKLEARIRDLFNIPSTAQLKMAYKDKENDVITVGNDEDLTDACVTQKINPLYIRVALATKAAGKENSPVAAEPAKVSSSEEPVKESSIPEKPMRKTVKIVDPVFQRILPPNRVPHMIEGIAKMMTSQMHVAKKVEATPSSSQPESNDPPALQRSNPTKEEEETKTEEKTESTDQFIRRAVCCSTCQMNPIVGPLFHSVKPVNYYLCGSCYAKEGNPNEYKQCKQPVTGRICAGRTSVKLVRTSPALAVGPASVAVLPLLDFGPHGARCSQVKIC